MIVLVGAGVAQLVEYELPKLGVAGSNPVARSTSPGTCTEEAREHAMGLFGGKNPEPRPADPAPNRAAATAPAAGTAPAPRPQPCVVGAQTTFKGELTAEEDVLVEGAVEGQIKVSRSLRIGTTSRSP